MKKLILTLCLAATGTFAAVAQMRLTLDQALDLALSENPTVKVAEMEVQRYDYVKRQTWGGLLPQVSVTGQVNHSFIVQQMSKGFSLGNDPYTTLSGAVDASVPLFAPQVYRMMKMNDKQMATAVEAARSSRITLTAEVKKAFYNILLAEQSLDVLRESQATVQRTVDDTQVQYQNGLTSEYDLLTAQVQLSNLKPSILQTENSIRIAKLMLKMYLSIPEQVDIEVEGELDVQREVVANLKKNIEVRSPITGVVTARNYESGDLFSAQPILHIMQIDPLKVIANISEQYFPNVKVGMPVELKVDIFPDQTFTGTVSLIYPALDPTTRTFKVEVKVPNARRTLRPGMYARTIFNMGHKEGVMVPDVAVQKQVGTAERFVYVIEGDSVARRRRVDVGRQVGDRVDILSGVGADEAVAVTALSKLYDGAKVEIKQE